MKEKKISVIIPSFNSARTIEHTLNALDLQRSGHLLSEVVVVDSSDDRETKRVLSEYASERTKIINAGFRIMPAIGRNIGAGGAKGEILAFLDADTYPADDWLENIMEAYENGFRVGGGGIEVPGIQENKLIALAQYYLQFNEYTSSGCSRVKDFVPSCNMFCQRELFHQVGGFPEIQAAEDVLFGLKVNKTARLWFLPELKVYHIFREHWRGFFANQMLIGRYVSIYRKRYYNSFIYRGPMPLIFFPAFLSIKFYRIASRIIRAGGSHLVRFIRILPIFLLGLLFWSIGFIKGSIAGEK